MKLTTRRNNSFNTQDGLALRPRVDEPRPYPWSARNAHSATCREEHRVQRSERGGHRGEAEEGAEWGA